MKAFHPRAQLLLLLCPVAFSVSSARSQDVYLEKPLRAVVWPYKGRAPVVGLYPQANLGSEPLGYLLRGQPVDIIGFDDSSKLFVKVRTLEGGKLGYVVDIYLGDEKGPFSPERMREWQTTPYGGPLKMLRYEMYVKRECFDAGDEFELTFISSRVIENNVSWALLAHELGYVYEVSCTGKWGGTQCRYWDVSDPDRLNVAGRIEGNDLILWSNAQDERVKHRIVRVIDPIKPEKPPWPYQWFLPEAGKTVYYSGPVREESLRQCTNRCGGDLSCHSICLGELKQSAPRECVK